MAMAVRRTVTLSAAELVALSKRGDETATLEHGDDGPFALFRAFGGEMHRKLAVWRLLANESLPPFTEMRARILIEGRFPHSKADDEEECDVVVGVSDGQTVWAVGRGEEGRDTLPPFPFDSPTRNGEGHFYDVYAQTGGDKGGFWAQIEYTQGAVFSKVWGKEQPEPSRMSSYRSSTNNLRPWVTVAPMVGPFSVLPLLGDDAASTREDITGKLVFVRSAPAAASLSPIFYQLVNSSTLTGAPPIAVIQPQAMLAMSVTELVAAATRSGVAALLLVAGGNTADAAWQEEKQQRHEAVIPVAWVSASVGTLLKQQLCSAGGGTVVCEGEAETKTEATFSWGLTQNKKELDDEAEAKAAGREAGAAAELVPWAEKWSEQRYPAPRLDGGLELVLYRDDPPQSYAFTGITVHLELSNGTGVVEGFRRYSRPRAALSQLQGTVLLLMIVCQIGAIAAASIQLHACQDSKQPTSSVTNACPEVDVYTEFSEVDGEVHDDEHSELLMPSAC